MQIETLEDLLMKAVGIATEMQNCYLLVLFDNRRYCEETYFALLRYFKGREITLRVRDELPLPLAFIDEKDEVVNMKVQDRKALLSLMQLKVCYEKRKLKNSGAVIKILPAMTYEASKRDKDYIPYLGTKGAIEVPEIKHLEFLKASKPNE